MIGYLVLQVTWFSRGTSTTVWSRSIGGRGRLLLTTGTSLNIYIYIAASIYIYTLYSTYTLHSCTATQYIQIIKQLLTTGTSLNILYIYTSLNIYIQYIHSCRATHYIQIIKQLLTTGTSLNTLYIYIQYIHSYTAATIYLDHKAVSSYRQYIAASVYIQYILVYSYNSLDIYTVNIQLPQYIQSAQQIN